MDWYGIFYTYDETGTLVSFNYDSNVATSGDGDEYFYLRNLQGDITSIVDSTGTIVVEYTYDAYGNILDTDVVSGMKILLNIILIVTGVIEEIRKLDGTICRADIMFLKLEDF